MSAVPVKDKKLCKAPNRRLARPALWQNFVDYDRIAYGNDFEQTRRSWRAADAGRASGCGYAGSSNATRVPKKKKRVPVTQRRRLSLV